MNTLSIAGDLDMKAPETELRFADGRVIRLPTALLQQPIPFPFEAGPGSPIPAEEDAIVIPLIEEQIQVGKRLVETGKVQLHKSVETYDVTLDEPLAVKTWTVERIRRNEVVEQAPLMRQEGETTIYPIVEERLVMTRELVLIEEVHVVKKLSERRDTQAVTLRRETLSVERHNIGK